MMARAWKGHRLMLRLRRHRKSLRSRYALPIVERLESRALLAMAATSVALSIPSQAIDHGQAETLTATVTAAGGLTVPDGESVAFSSGTTVLGSAPLTSNVAKFTTAALAPRLVQRRAELRRRRELLTQHGVVDGRRHG
jgi:hypothetical protein